MGDFIVRIMGASNLTNALLILAFIVIVVLPMVLIFFYSLYKLIRILIEGLLHPRPISEEEAMMGLILIGMALMDDDHD